MKWRRREQSHAPNADRLSPKLVDAKPPRMVSVLRRDSLMEMTPHFRRLFSLTPPQGKSS